MMMCHCLVAVSVTIKPPGKIHCQDTSSYTIHHVWRKKYQGVIPFNTFSELASRTVSPRCNQPEFKCDKWDFSTKDKNLLGNHKRYKHSPTKAQKDPEFFFKCSWCPYQSKRKANLERHIGKCQAKKRIEPLNMVPFSKEELGKIFSETDCTATDFNVILR